MYPTKSSVGLYELDRRPDSWIVESIRIATGIDLQASIRISEEHNEISTVLLQDLGVKQMLYQVSSTAPPIDRVRFWLRTRGISPVNLETIDLHSSFVSNVDDQLILNA